MKWRERKRVQFVGKYTSPLSCPLASPPIKHIHIMILFRNGGKCRLFYSKFLKFQEQHQMGRKFLVWVLQKSGYTSRGCLISRFLENVVQQTIRKVRGFKAESFGQMESTHSVFHGYCEEPYLPGEMVSLKINQLVFIFYFSGGSCVHLAWPGKPALCFLELYNNVQLNICFYDPKVLTSPLWFFRALSIIFREINCFLLKLRMQQKRV